MPPNEGRRQLWIFKDNWTAAADDDAKGSVVLHTRALALARPFTQCQLPAQLGSYHHPAAAVAAVAVGSARCHTLGVSE